MSGISLGISGGGLRLDNAPEKVASRELRIVKLTDLWSWMNLRFL